MREETAVQQPGGDTNNSQQRYLHGAETRDLKTWDSLV